MTPRREWTVVGALLAFVLLVLGAANFTEAGISANYLVSVLLLIAIYAIFSLGLNLEFGFAGLINFGHVLTMLVAAYTVAILVPKAASVPDLLAGWSIFGFLASLLVALLVGTIIAVPLLHAWGHRPGTQETDPRRTGAAWGAAGAIAFVVLLLLFPLSSEGARTMVVLLAVLTGMGVAAVAGYLLGLPGLRLREDYLAIVAIGAAEILRSIAVNEAWLTRGTLGIQQLDRPVVRWALDSPTWNAIGDFIDVRPVTLAHAVLAVALLGLVYAFLAALARSPWGRVLKAIREDEDVAAALGKDVRRFKLQALMIGSAIGGLAGVLLVWHLSNVYPEHFLPIVTFYAFIIVIVGGAGNLRGTLAGAIILWGVFELAGSVSRLEQLGIRNVAGPPQGILIGLLIILVMMFRPQGVLGRKEEMRFAR